MTSKDRTRTSDRSPAGTMIAAGFLGAGLCAGAAGAETGLSQHVDPVLDRWVESQRIVGVTAVVLRDGAPVYSRAMVFADREADQQAREETIYRLASMTKAIVSATALALVDADRLSLDDHVADWLPGFTPVLADGRRPDITVRQLLTHTSGLSYSVFEPPESAYHREAVPDGLHQDGETLDGAMRRIASVSLVYAPGTEWRYSVSTDVLGAVVARAAGMTLPEAVERYVTGPLGMSDTTFVVADPARLSAAYKDGAGAAERLHEDGDTIPFGDPGVAFSPARRPGFRIGGAGLDRR